MKFLLVEDDIHLSEVIAEALSDFGYIVDVALDGEIGWQQAIEQEYNLILLDVTLPKLDGIKLCQRLRAKGCLVPIMMVTARDSSTDKVTGLDAGADDYIIKPIDLPELLARIRALIRRGNTSMLPNLTWGDLKMNPSNYEVSYSNHDVHLTPKEFSLLQLFLHNGRRVLSPRMIIDHVWVQEDPPEEESVKAHIKALRQKLKSAGAPSDFIETVRGIGYRFKQVD